MCHGVKTVASMLFESYEQEFLVRLHNLSKTSDISSQSHQTNFST
jgi:hypothetical protein